MNHSTLYPFALFLHVVGVMALVWRSTEWSGQRCFDSVARPSPGT